jgi:hypothetical protein
MVGASPPDAVKSRISLHRRCISFRAVCAADVHRSVTRRDLN